jgi:hypothetical protein
MVGAHVYQGARWAVFGEVPHVTGNHHASNRAVRWVSLR